MGWQKDPDPQVTFPSSCGVQKEGLLTVDSEPGQPRQHRAEGSRVLGLNTSVRGDALAAGQQNSHI